MRISSLLFLIVLLGNSHTVRGAESSAAVSEAPAAASPATASPTSGTPVPFGIAVIANSTVPIRNLELHELKSVILGERGYWNSGVAVKLVALAESTPEAAAVRERVCGMSARQLKRHWLELLFRGDGHAPQVVTAADELCRLVAGQPGAIGCVTIEEALECAQRHPDGVVLLSVNGVLPRDPGYPLH